MDDGTLLIVVGMASEARLVTGLGRVIVGRDSFARLRPDGARAVLSFGLCGALDPALAPGDLVIGSRVTVGDRTLPTDVGWAARLSRDFPQAVTGAVAGSETIVASSTVKAALRDATRAIATDMESHLAASLATELGLPFAVIRAVSDGAEDDLPASAQAGFGAGGSTDIKAVIRALAANPRELPALIRVARNAGAGFSALRSAAKVLKAYSAGSR